MLTESAVAGRGFLPTPLAGCMPSKKIPPPKKKPGLSPRQPPRSLFPPLRGLTYLLAAAFAAPEKAGGAFTRGHTLLPCNPHGNGAIGPRRAPTLSGLRKETKERRTKVPPEPLSSRALEMRRASLFAKAGAFGSGLRGCQINGNELKFQPFKLLFSEFILGI